MNQRHYSTHRQFVVESFEFDEQAVVSRNQLILQLSHISIKCRLRQIISQNIHKKIEEDQTGRGKDNS